MRLRWLWALFVWVGRAVRWQEWYASKLPFVWLACFSGALTSRLGVFVLEQRVAAVILFVCLCAAFGHVVNDYADRESDRIAGKRSVVATLTLRGARLTIVALGGAALCVLALLWTSPIAVAAGASTLVLAAAYSLPPVRLKNRGAAGVWVAAAAQRTFPVLLALAALGPLDVQAWALAAVAQLAGIRWMLVHQVADAANDRSAQVATYVVTAGEAWAQTLLQRVVLPLEFVAIVAALASASLNQPAVWLVGAAGIIACAIWVVLCGGLRFAYSLNGYARQPFAGFYFAIWPIGAGLLLIQSRPDRWPILAVFLLWQWRYIAVQLSTIGRMAWERLRSSGAKRQDS